MDRRTATIGFRLSFRSHVALQDSGGLRRCKDNWKGTLCTGRSNPESMKGFVANVNKEYENVEEKMTTSETDSVGDGSVCANGHVVYISLL